MRLPLRVLTTVCLFVLTLTATGLGQARRPASAAELRPTTFDVMEKSIEDLQRALQARDVTSRQLVDIYLARIDAYDRQGPALNAITAVNPRTEGR